MGGRVPGHHHVRQSVNHCDQGTVSAKNISKQQQRISHNPMVKLLHKYEIKTSVLFMIPNDLIFVLTNATYLKDILLSTVKVGWVVRFKK